MQIYDGRKELYQWDIKPKITSNRFKVGEEIHFTNIRLSEALPVLTKEYNGKVVVEVPSILLQNSLPITAYWYVKNDDGSFTKEEYLLSVKQRPKPKDYVYTETETLTIEDYVKKFFDEAIKNENFGGVVAKTARIGEVTLLTSKWVGENNLYSQVVDIEGVTKYSQVDLTPNIQQLAIFYEKDLAFVTENEDGVVTVFCIGQKPQNDYTIQVTMTEVAI